MEKYTITKHEYYVETAGRHGRVLREGFATKAAAEEFLRDFVSRRNEGQAFFVTRIDKETGDYHVFWSYDRRGSRLSRATRYTC